MVLGIDPKNDFAFKCVFGSERHTTSRLLCYWAKVYAGQLLAGDRYEALQPVISICFLDAILFPQTDRYHLRFRLVDETLGLTYCDDLEMHLFQLPNFVKTADALADPLDSWLYFLNNASELDASHLPLSLKRPEIEEAVEVLTMLTQDEIQRELYEAREKARRDAASWQWNLDHFRQEAERAKQEAERLKREVATGRAAGLARGELIGQIRVYARLLGRTPTPEDHLTAMSLDELKALLDQLNTNFSNRDQS